MREKAKSTKSMNQSRDGRIVIFCRIPDSVNRRQISGRFRIQIRIFDVTLPLAYTYQNYSKSRPMLYFSVIFNRQ